MTTAVDSTIVEKIQKLLALSTSSNPHEAALAAAKAQELLFKYNLDMATVEAGPLGAAEKYIRQDFTLVEEMAEWQRTLMFVVSRNNFCKAIAYGHSIRMCIVGQKSNIEVTMYLYAYLAFEIIKLSADHPKKRENMAFCRGAVDGIRQVMDERKAALQRESVESRSLVIVKDDELNRATYDLVGPLGRFVSKAVRNPDAYYNGVAAGRNINVRAGVRGNPRPQLGA